MIPHRWGVYILNAQSFFYEPNYEITGLVGRLFGKKALEDSNPGGMKRLSAEDGAGYFEMWPAPVDEWAAPLDGDSPDVALLRPLLAKTQMEKVPLRLAYDANRNGWDTAAFHAAVDTFGATLIVCTSEGGAIFGGYNPRGFIGLGEDRDSIAAFLFTWPDGDTRKLPLKMPKVGGASLAVVDKPDVIQFGAEGLTVLDTRGDEKMAKCRLGTYYARTPSGGRTLFSDKEDAKKTRLKELKAYVMIGEGETWELDGIVWKTGMKS